MLRKGGVAPRQWVLGKFPRGAGHLLEEEEWGQLGVVQGTMDSTREFGLLSQYRLESRKQFVEQGVSQRGTARLLRKSVPMPKHYRQGDPVCYMKRQGANTPDEAWRGPSGVFGAENRVMWNMHNGIPAARVVHNVRPATTAELPVYQVVSGNVCPFDGDDPSLRKPGK